MHSGEDYGRNAARVTESHLQQAQKEACVMGLCRLIPAQAGAGRAAACEGKPWGEVTTSQWTLFNPTLFSSSYNSIHSTGKIVVMQTHVIFHPTSHLGQLQPHTFSGAQSYSSPSHLGERLTRAWLHPHV